MHKPIEQLAANGTSAIDFRIKEPVSDVGGRTFARTHRKRTSLVTVEEVEDQIKRFFEGNESEIG